MFYFLVQTSSETDNMFCSSAYSNVSWKRAQPAPLAINKNSAGYRQPVGGATHGRTDWAAKYVYFYRALDKTYLDALKY